MKLKNIVKQLLGQKSIDQINKVRKLIRKNKLLVNVKKTNYSQSALLSYITEPFIREYLNHTNSFEATSWANVLSELGYNVDVINYDSNKNLDLSKYDVICGFGNVFQKYFENYKLSNIKTIYYGTGMDIQTQNVNTLNRVKDVYNKKGVWLGRSARFVEKTWSHGTILVDAIIALGNDVCATSYKHHYDGDVYSLSAPFYNIDIAESVFKNRKESSKTHFLWFGSSGLIHKGLDLLLEFFSKHQELTLHICGNIYNEPEFVSAYKKELFGFNNIINHGFIDISSTVFRDILVMCSFAIFPSCSEGGCPSVLTVIGNGGLIPIISKQTTISTGHEIWVNEFSDKGIEESVQQALSFEWSKIQELQRLNYELVLRNNNQSQYYNELKQIIKEII